jgi:hypothetical protein
MACDCDTVCPGAGQCGCLEIIKPDGSTHCCCDCSPDPIFLALEPEDEVAFSVRNRELAELAEHVHRVTGAELLIPVTELRKPITTTIERTSFPDAVQRLGLVLAESGDSAY